MSVGIIKWFGGVNKKTGRANNFGFLTTAETGCGEELYFNQKDVLTEKQNLLESGVYIEFETVTYNSDRKQAASVKPIPYVGIIDWFNDGRGYINCENIPDVRIKTSQSLKSGDIVFFFRRYNQVYKRDEAISLQKVDTSNQDKLVIERCVNSKLPVIYKPFLVDYVLNLSEDKSIEFILSKIDQLDNWSKQQILNSLMAKSSILFLGSPKLRQLLASFSDVSEYCNFINRHLSLVSQSLREEIVQELISQIKKQNSWLRSQYWNQIDFLKQNIKYKGYLWDIAPDNIKIKLIKERYQEFFDLIQQFEQSEYPYSKELTIDLSDLYQFNNIDENLINIWCPKKNGSPSDFELARMMSARGAEKLAFNFYKALGYSVEDTAAHQVTHQSDTWIKGDIRLNSNLLIDVKNARTTVNSDTYSEFCVPAFKQSRGSNVLITAVLSPYLRASFMRDPNSVNFAVMKPTILGSLKNNTLLTLESIFSDRLLSIDIARNSSSNRYLPPWLFDYDDKFYAEQHKIISKFRTLLDSDIPDWEDIEITEAKVFPLLIAAKIKLPNKWQNNVSAWKADFINYFANVPEDNISLPYLFLGLLKHFLNNLSKKDEAYSPKHYQDLIYVNYSQAQPLKIYDPLNIINNFCAILQTLWENREVANLDKFTMFKFNGQGLLEGKKGHSDIFFTTILAYCGGWVEGKGKCGHRPLVVGRHSNCSACGKLICPKDDCQFCSHNCRGHEQRKHHQLLTSNYNYFNF